MSFEDDEYWDEEYADNPAVSNAAVAQERHFARRDVPEPIIPTRRPGPERVVPSRRPDPEPVGHDHVDELAARRQRRAGGGARARRPQAAFDSQRPSWLDDPDFVPIDTSVPDLVGSEFADVDFNRPELGADFDAPEFPIGDPAGADPRRSDDRFAEFADYEDDIDEPYDHRDLASYGHAPEIARPGGPVYADPDDWDDDLDTPIRPAGGRRAQRSAGSGGGQRSGASPADRRGPATDGRRRAAPSERGPAPADRRGPAPSERRGPAPSERRGPAPSERRGPAPSERRGPAPSERRGDRIDRPGFDEPAATGRARVPEPRTEDDARGLYRRPEQGTTDPRTGRPIDPRTRRPIDADGREQPRDQWPADGQPRGQWPPETLPGDQWPADQRAGGQRPAWSGTSADEDDARHVTAGDNDQSFQPADDQGRADWPRPGVRAPGQIELPADEYRWDDADTTDGPATPGPATPGPATPGSGTSGSPAPAPAAPGPANQGPAGPAPTGGDVPPVVSKTPPPAPPRVISKATPAPRVVKKSDPPAPPRVATPTPPGQAPRVVSAPPAAAAAQAATTPPPADPAPAPGAPHQGGQAAGSPGPVVPAPASVRPIVPAPAPARPIAPAPVRPPVPAAASTPPAVPPAGAANGPAPTHQAPGAPVAGTVPATGAARYPSIPNSARPLIPGQGPGRPGQGGAPGQTSAAPIDPRGGAGQRPGQYSVDERRMGLPAGPVTDADLRASGQYPAGAVPPVEGGQPYPPGRQDVPAPRSRRTPRTAHVVLSENDGPWAMVPDDAPPAAVPVTGLSRPISATPNSAPPASAGTPPAPPQTGPVRPTSPAPGSATPTPIGDTPLPSAPGDGRTTPPATPEARPMWPAFGEVRPALPATGDARPAAEHRDIGRSVVNPGHPATGHEAHGRAAVGHTVAAHEATGQAEAGQAAGRAGAGYPAAGPHDTGRGPAVGGPPAEVAPAAHAGDARDPGPRPVGRPDGPDREVRAQRVPPTGMPPGSQRLTGEPDNATGAAHAAQTPAGIAATLISGAGTSATARPVNPTGATYAVQPPAGITATTPIPGAPAAGAAGAHVAGAPATARPVNPTRVTHAAQPPAGITATTPIPGAPAGASTAANPAGAPPPAQAQARAYAAGTHVARPTASTHTDGTPVAAQSGEAVPGVPHIGAHAAPYMDPDGTLHNLRPIARLAVSGPDAAPHRHGDSGFGSMWFAPNAPAGDRPDQTRASTDQYDNDRRGTAEAGANLSPATPGAETSATDSQASTPDLPTRKRVQRTDSGRPASTDGQHRTPAQRADGEAAGVVIDLDLNGLLGGASVTAGQPATAGSRAAGSQSDGGAVGPSAAKRATPPAGRAAEPAASRAAEPPSSRAAEPPSSRAAEPPSSRAAEPAGSRAVEQPAEAAAGRPSPGRPGGAVTGGSPGRPGGAVTGGSGAAGPGVPWPPSSAGSHSASAGVAGRPAGDAALQQPNSDAGLDAEAVRAEIPQRMNALSPNRGAVVPGTSAGQQDTAVHATAPDGHGAAPNAAATAQNHRGARPDGSAAVGGNGPGSAGNGPGSAGNANGPGGNAHRPTAAEHGSAANGHTTALDGQGPRAGANGNGANGNGANGNGPSPAVDGHRPAGKDRGAAGNGGETTGNGQAAASAVHSGNATPPRSAQQHGAQQPGARQQDGQQPGTQQPGTQQPGTQQPGTQQPGTQQPGTQQPGTQQPGTQQPGTQQPGTQQPGTQQPGTQQRDWQQPGAWQRSGQQPGVTGQDGSAGRQDRALAAADLEAIRWRLDGASLREVVDDREALRELGERLDGPLADEADNVAKAGLLSVRAEVYRLLGELGMAAAASRLALVHAESAQDVQSTVIAQAELAHVLRLRGDFAEADRLFAKAAGAPVPDPLRSVVHENAGRSCFDQGRHMEALDHFARAVRLGRPDDTDLAERIGVCLQAVYIHVLRDGWGPYPRRSLELIGVSGPTQPDPGRQPTSNALDEPTAERPAVHPR
jgi:hypothetical protein